MSTPRIVSIIPYKILPAKLGGEKGIALFNEYLGKQVPITGIATRNNDAAAARNYIIQAILSNSRLRYINPFLYFTIRRIIKETQATHLLIEHPYYGWLAWLLRKTLPVTWVVHSHNIEYMRSQSIGRWWWKGLKWYEQWVYKKADLVFFISDDDRQHAITQLKIPAAKSHTITYGIEQAGLPEDMAQCRAQVQQQHGIGEHEKILLFNGALYHHTNYDALSVILKTINPQLLQQNLPYKIIVCGKGLPASFNELKEYRDQHIIYAGFVDDISVYFKAADVFLNPILSGGGVKTKAIEAIAMNCTVVSTPIGALGIPKAVCGAKLQVAGENDWPNFTQQVIYALQTNADTPATFFDYYYWGNITSKAVALLKSGHA